MADTGKYTFPNGVKFEITENEGGEKFVTFNPQAKEVMVLGFRGKLDRAMQRTYLTAGGDHFRFDAYGNKLNNLSKDGWLQLHRDTNLKNTFAITAEAGHVSANFDLGILQAKEGIYVQGGPMTLEKYPFGWALVGQQAGKVYIHPASKPLIQSRKLDCLRGIQAGLKTKIKVDHIEAYLDTLMESWLEPDDEKANAIREKNMANGAAAKQFNYQVRKAMNPRNNATVMLEGDDLVQTGEGGRNAPQTVIASNLTINKKGGGTVEMKDLPAGVYTVWTQYGRSIARSAERWDPAGMTEYMATRWQVHIEANNEIELV
jgi:hypothetical protein